MLGSPAGPGGQRGLWPLAPAPAPSAASFTTDGFGKCGVYSLFPGGPTFGSALYSHARTIGQITSSHIQQSSTNPFYHKDSLFSSTGYTFGAPTPPPGSQFSPVPVTQLELLTKGFNTSNIIIQQQQQQEYYASQSSPVKKSNENNNNKKCDEKCCSVKHQTKICSLHQSSINNKKCDVVGGCSRTNPIEWNSVNVKKEPGTTPCQVAEISTSVSPVIKLEVTSPRNSCDGIVSSNSELNANVPVGIAVARQRFHQQEVIRSPSLPPAGLLTTVNAAAQIREVGRLAEIGESAGMAAVGAGGATLLQCTDERSAPMAGWPMGGTHNPAMGTPTLWQYPAPVPMEPMVPLPVPIPPSGFHLVRDPTIGGFLLLPGLEPLHQTVVWPSYHHSPPLLLPPPPPLQLLSSATSDYLSSSTTLHQHTQTHSTRLVTLTTDTKQRKLPLPLPATTLIKIETDAATLDQTKTLQAMSTIASNTGTVYTDQNMHPLVTTHVIYQHPAATNLIIQQPSASIGETICKGSTPVVATCLTPPPEVASVPPEEPSTSDASNQTDTPLCSEDDSTRDVGKEESASITSVPEQVPEISTQTDEEEIISPTPDISGLELLSNSIFQLENVQKDDVLTGIATMSLKDTEKVEQVDDNLGGLDLLCALAEQRIMEENVAKTKKSKEHKKEKRKSKKHSGDEPRRKKTKVEPPSVSQWHGANQKELDMRIRLAELQRQYREKHKELSKLKPKSAQKASKRSRSTPPPPVLDKETPPTPSNKEQLLKPPTLCAFESIKPIQSPKLEAIKQSDRIINDYKNDLLRQQALEESQSSHSSSKKRKVGRPKKLLSPSGFHVTTETIVAKKPKNNFVGYLLAAKEKLQKMQYASSPPRYLEEPYFGHQTKIRDNNNTIGVEELKSCKIRPKLKAEPTIKTTYEEEEDVEENWDPVKPEAEDEEELMGEEAAKEVKVEEEVKSIAVVDSRCTLTSEHLEIDKLRVLTAMGGLFYAGHLNAVEPPDVYSITLDGERGNRPHIMSREEILRDAIVEVAPKSTKELVAGIRLCAYWSQQYRCLYPGSVAEPGTPDPELDCKFVPVEFDDGDSGRIAIDDIRFLPNNYPIIEYDPNPLLSLSKRRRRASASISTDERRRSVCKEEKVQKQTPIILPDMEVEKENKDIINKPDDALNQQQQEQHHHHQQHKERKRLKKKKREKLKQKLLNADVDKKRRKKHKCIDEFCKHRKHHKKHRKHKKHHHSNAEKKEAKAAIIDAHSIPENNNDVVEKNERFEEMAEADNVVINPEDEVTMDDVMEANKSKKIRDRQESCESRSKMSAFLPARQLWGWSGKGYKRPRARGKSRKIFYKSIQRGKETITVGDSAVFLSTGRPDRPYIGKIESMWELCGKMVVKVKWFYHPEETIGCPSNLQYPGALFESPHVDENDVQTISHKCEVLPLKEYTHRLGDDPQRYETIYDNNDIYYLAGYYDPTTTTLKMEPEIPFSRDD